MRSGYQKDSTIHKERWQKRGMQMISKEEIILKYDSVVGINLSNKYTVGTATEQVGHNTNVHV